MADEDGFIPITEDDPLYAIVMEGNYFRGCSFSGGQSMSCGGTCQLTKYPVPADDLGSGSGSGSGGDVVVCYRCINPGANDHGATICMTIRG